MTVLHLLGPLRPSGMERMLISSAPYWDDHDVTPIVVGQGADHPFRAELEGAGYDVRHIVPVRSRAGLQEWRALVTEINPSIVHIHTEQAFVSAVWGARHVPQVRTVHNAFPVRGTSSWSRRIQARLADGRVNAFIAPSQDVAANEAVVGRSCEVILNWVDDRFQGIGEGPREPYAVIVGNASPIKRHLLALEALVATASPVAYVGSEANASPHEKALLDELESKGLLLHRGVGDPEQWLRRASVFLMPSVHEGMGVALAEALSVGTPALVCDVPGLRWSQSEPGVTVLEPTVKAWAAAIKRALRDAYSSASPEHDFSASRGVHAYVQVYVRAIAASTRADG